MVRAALLVLGFALALPRPAAAQEPYVIPRLEEPITLDGLSDEPAWTAIEPLPLVMQIPTFRGTPTETTELRIAYDDTHVYVAARCYDDPDGIRGTSFKRDQLSSRSDNLALILDTFDDNENGLAFFTFPTGARTDFTVFNDAEGDFPFNPDWNTFWTVEVARNTEGWFAEMRIPFSSLRFQDEDGRVEMGVHLQRYIARKHEVVGYPALERKYGPWSWAKPSLARTIVFEGIQSTRPLYVSPYAIGGFGEYAELNGSETAYHTVNERVSDAGLDLTANPDFAQVEADDQQVNLTRFSLFFPEKRRFFQERASTFAFRFEEQDRLFYSRRIGLHDGEEAQMQDLYTGEILGQPYFPLQAARLHAFGGTTGHWAGFCAPLDPIDFQVRDWVPHSGWPLRRNELDPFYARAQKLVELGPYAYEAAYWTRQDPDRRELPLSRDVVWTKMWQFSPPTRFGTTYRDEITEADNVHLYTYANAVEVEANEPVRAAEGIRVKTPNGKEHRARARHYVLACGALQNARLLLASNRQAPDGLGNDHDLVGRYFMEHIEMPSAQLILAEPQPMDLYMLTFLETKARGELSLTADVQREQRILNGVASLDPGVYEELRGTFQQFTPEFVKNNLRLSPEELETLIEQAQQDAPDQPLPSEQRAFKLFTRQEQAPNPHSRVTLSDETDALGDFRLVRYHRRGYAGSTAAEGPLDTYIERAAGDAQSLLRHLGVDRAHVVGHSYGGLIALQLALDAPESVHSLVLLEPPLPNPNASESAEEATPPGMESYRAGDPIEAVDQFLQAYVTPEWRIVVASTVPGGVEQAERDARTNFEIESPAWHRWNFDRGKAEQISQPILYVTGSEGYEIPDFVHAWWPQMEHRVVPDVTHALQMEDPRLIAEEIAGFLGRHPF